MRDIGKNIKTLRTQKNMTQDELAEKLFVTRQTVSNYETGRSRPDVEMLAKIAEVLETDANTVIYGLPAEVSKKREYIKATISAAIVILLSLPLPWLKQTTDELMAYRFLPWPRLLLAYWYHPLLLLVLGWTAMQLLSLVTRLVPLPRVKTKGLLLACMIFSAFYVVMMTCLLLPFTKPRWLIYVYYFIMGVWPKGLSFNWTHLFLPLGALLWLCSFPCKKQQDK